MALTKETSHVIEGDYFQHFHMMGLLGELLGSQVRTRAFDFLVWPPVTTDSRHPFTPNGSRVMYVWLEVNSWKGIQPCWDEIKGKKKLSVLVSAIVCPSDPLSPQQKVLCLFPVLVNSYGCACLSWTVVSWRGWITRVTVMNKYLITIYMTFASSEAAFQVSQVLISNWEWLRLSWQ